MVYDEGGGCFCPQWDLSAQSQNRTRNCRRREYQEDYIACNLKMSIPSSPLCKGGPKEVYFFLHVGFNTYKQASRTLQNRPCVSHTLYSQEAFNNRYVSGSTATVVLLVDGQILVANIGDPKALLCSEKIKPALGDGGTTTIMLDVEDLTRDHRPDRDDEKAQIEASGGFMRTYGVPCVNGILAVSRSIGNVYMKCYCTMSASRRALPGNHLLNEIDRELTSRAG
ncbi:probable protein phosphatase 2C 51 [Actinidia eriantha]|uniref:probable protein phosphatase 2C 51 n=1 Tax=Actinidia eriantha TaxID=165200 RepID=UPI002587B895|nr:probable protein phosphatase 2C 51 [Actinidia eriantha]